MPGIQKSGGVEWQDRLQRGIHSLNQCPLLCKTTLMVRIAQLYIYPIKSLGSISLTQAVVEEKGFRYD